MTDDEVEYEPGLAKTEIVVVSLLFTFPLASTIVYAFGNVEAAKMFGGVALFMVFICPVILMYFYENHPEYVHPEVREKRGYDYDD